MLHDALVLYRRTMTFSYIVSTNHKSPRLRISLYCGHGGWGDRAAVIVPSFLEKDVERCASFRRYSAACGLPLDNEQEKRDAAARQKAGGGGGGKVGGGAG